MHQNHRCFTNDPSKKHQTIITEASRKINVSQIGTIKTKSAIIKIENKILSVWSRFHHWIIHEAAKKHQRFRDWHKKNLGVNFASIDISTIPSISLQRVINESWLKQQRKITVLEISKKYNLWSWMFASKSLLFQQCFFRQSPNNYQRSTNKTLTFWNLGPQKEVSSLEFASKSSMVYRNFFKEFLAKKQPSSNELSRFRILAH